MNPDPEHFSQRLIAETLLYDAEMGLIGMFSLIDPEEAHERYIASYLPAEEHFLIERATAWEDDVALEEDTDVAYALAIESDDHGTYDSAEAAAVELIRLAEAHSLLPSFMVLFEDEEL